LANEEFETINPDSFMNDILNPKKTDKDSKPQPDKNQSAKDS